jgi:uncharacterized membrane protein
LPVRPRHPDLLLIVALTLTGVAAVMTSPGGGLIRLLFGLPLALVLPGYALTAALFPGPAPGPAERIALILGISLASLAVVGLALNVTAPGLTATTWTAALATLTLAAVLLAVRRRKRHPEETVRFPVDAISIRQWTTFGLAGLVLIGALLIAREGALEPRGAGFTQLWMLPQAQPAGSEVRIGVTSRERSPVVYRLELESGSQVQTSWLLELAPGESWQTTVSVKPVAGARTAAVLFRLDRPGPPYRQVALASSR